MRRFIDKTFKPFFLITGVGTAAAGMNAFFPKFTVENVQQLTYIPDYTIFVQHWGIMVCLMGLFMVAAAFKTSWRAPILLYSTVEKAFMVFLVVVNINHPFAKGFWAPAAMDALVVIYSIAYFVSLKGRDAPA